MKLREDIMSTATANRGQLGHLIADKLITRPVEVRAAIYGKMKTLKRAIRRKNRGGAPVEPAGSVGIPHPIPPQYTTPMPDGDNGSTDARLLVFASDTGLRLLGRAKTWLCDGTHSTAPKQFVQLFCICVPRGNGNVTAAYALLTGKQ
ncbi:hypothetical protein DPMN_147229 [Dreissena polymorpha]|uniref:Uncharacterized protein n=1 Tax=Dreissena polymorpha TaxID=45954 RepID=A0A9D4F9H9_DREPO|nr:hypothetical protein DPMN_147229 [Dreissena polymorpha]